MAVDVKGKRCVVVGAGASGVAAADLLTRAGASVVMNDSRTRAELTGRASELERVGVSLALGSHDPEVFEDAELVVVSPGVPPLAVFAEVEARGVEIIAEVELAARFLKAPLVAITGTNGKSTVTTLVGDMLRRSGRATFVGGNLGTALSDAVGTPADTAEGVAVVELSSFQLERVRDLRPRVAVLLNCTADHLDRYAGFDAYARAKARIFGAQREGDHAVLPSGDRVCANLGPLDRRPTRHGFGGEEGMVRVEGDEIVDQHAGWRFPIEEFGLRGRHNLDNACAAVLTARLAGATPEAMAESLRAATGLPHRAEVVRTLEGTLYVDDSKATNVGAAIASLAGFASAEQRAVLIAGGVDKGGSYLPLARALGEVGRGVVLIGEAAQLIADAFDGLDVPVSRAETMSEAVARARDLAEPGDVVLLAPACSSYDMYRSYAHRGDAFQVAVAALEPRRTG